MHWITQISNFCELLKPQRLKSQGLTNARYKKYLIHLISLDLSAVRETKLFLRSLNHPDSRISPVWNHLPVTGWRCSSASDRQVSVVRDRSCADGLAWGTRSICGWKRYPWWARDERSLFWLNLGAVVVLTLHHVFQVKYLSFVNWHLRCLDAASYLSNKIFLLCHNMISD